MQLNKFNKYIFPGILAAMALVVAALNYAPGTWLTGWDNLHPEFNLGLNIRRAFSAVWEEYQGVGLLAGNAHAADLPRQLVLSILSSFVPLSLLRYFWTFLMLVAGPLGTYFLTNLLVKAKGGLKGRLPGFVAGIFYLLNLATVQYFYTPFETFVSFYGFLPWLIYLALLYLRDKTKVRLAWFGAVSFLATCAFHVQTMFLVYVFALGIFVLEALVRGRKNVLGAVGKLILTVFVVNAFWLMPAAYFTLTSGDVVKESKINSIATPETRLMNESKGDVTDVALLRGYWFDYLDVDKDGQFEYLMPKWREHVAKDSVQIVGYALFAAAVIGFLLSVFGKGINYKFAPVVVFVFAFAMLGMGNPPFGFVFNFLEQSVPLFGEIFRSVFTKWSVVLALGVSMGLAFLTAFWGKFKNMLSSVLYALAALFIAGSIWMVFPVFSGKLIHEPLKVEIPEAYFDLFEFMETQPKEARVTFFPMQTLWGWNFYDWGYRGSGFLWYGIEQPILDRAFDVWSEANESYYIEASDAFYGFDSVALTKVFEKYNVSYVLIDKSVELTNNKGSVLSFDTMEIMLDQMGAEEVWKKENLSVYKVRGEAGFLGAPEDYVVTNVDLAKVRRDILYERYGDYVSGGGVDYVFSNLLRETVSDLKYETSVDGDKVFFSSDLTGEDIELVVPGLDKGTNYSLVVEARYENRVFSLHFENPTEIKVGNEELNFPELPDVEMEVVPGSPDSLLVSINDQVAKVNKNTEEVFGVSLTVGDELNIKLFDASSPKAYESESNFLESSVNECWSREGTEGELETEVDGDVLRIKTRDVVGCFAQKIGKLESSTGLLEVSLPFKSENGARPHFCVVKEGSGKCLNDEIFYNSYASEDWSEVERRLVLPGGEANVYWIEIAARPSDEVGEEWTINYRTPETVSYPLVSEVSFDRDVWQHLVEESRFDVSSGELNVWVYARKQELDFEKSLSKTLRNCDVFERGSVDRQITSTGANYETEGYAAACDYASLPSTSTRQNYLVRLEGVGEEGRALKTYLRNKATSSNDSESILDTTHYDTVLPVLSWPSVNDSDYVLNFEGRSFGGESKNTLEKVSVYDFPVEWLAKWKIEPENVSRRQNSVEVLDIQKTGTYKYEARVQVSDEPGLVVLSQGYDDGWIAFSEGKKLSHIKVNSCANGWEVPEGEHEVTIIYWPQYLEFVGFGLLVAGGLGIGLMKGKREAKSVSEYAGAQG